MPIERCARLAHEAARRGPRAGLMPDAVARVRADGLLAAWRRTRAAGLGVLVLAIVFYWWLVMAVQASPADWAFDFRQFWQGGKDVLDGVSPYPTAEQLARAGTHLGPEGIQDVFRFPYPAGAAVALAPLGALEFHAAAAVWSALLILSLLASLWLLGVRDWRIAAIVVTSAPVISSVRLGTLTPLLLLLLAVSWRWRDRSWITGSSLGVAMALKLFLWPLVLWFLFTRRYASAGISAGVAAFATLAGWAVIGFDGLTTYPELVRRLTDVVADRGYSLVALVTEVGLPRSVADLAPTVVGAVLTLAALAIIRKRGDERVTYSLCVLAAIAFSPIVWLHYFTLLVVPLSLARRPLIASWAVLWIFWLTPVQENLGDLWRVLVVTAVVAATGAWAVVVGDRRGEVAA
jgi:hypothetical protein